MDPANQAITAALNRDWKQAIALNQQLLKQNPKDLDALNRLGRAYLETGQKTKSSQIYTKVLRLDKFNSIATKSLELLKTMRIHRPAVTPPLTSAPIFLEEPGVTKTVNLTRPGDVKIITRLHAGDPVLLAAREHCVVVTTPDNEYLGRLPDDLAMRMRSFLRAGNRYEIWIRAVEINPGSGSSRPNLKVFIKEIFRAHKFRNTPSFPPTEKLSYAAFTPPNLVYTDKPIVSTPEEDNPSDDDSDNSDDSDSPPEHLPPPED